MTEREKDSLIHFATACKYQRSGANCTDWGAVAQNMHDKCGIDLPGEKWKNQYRSITGLSHKARAERSHKESDAREVTDEQILSALGVKRTPQQDADILHVPVTAFVRRADKLKDAGYNITEAAGTIWLERAALPSYAELREPYDGETKIAFGVVSDTHLCNKNQQLTYLNDFYDRCAAEGITTIYHAGDISDGFYKSRPDHIYELFKIGFDEQADYIIENYPRRNGITTKFITGNHDATHLKNGGADIGSRIAERRPDMEYLGYMSAKVWLTPQCDADLFHPLDGSCFDDQTEILTRNGWKLFKDLTTSDAVATMTKSNWEFEWQNPEFITKIQYNGPMYHIKSRTVDMMITPNHGLWVRRYPEGLNRLENPRMPQKGHFSVNTEWHMEKAESIVSTYARQKWQMTNHCLKWNGIVDKKYVDVPFIESKNIGMKRKMKHIGRVGLMDMCELIAWYVTEGHADHKRVCICQSQRVNPENHKMITDLFKRMGIGYNARGRDNKDIYIGSVELASYLINICGSGSRNKYLPNFIKALPSEYLYRVLDIMIRGDGWINGFGYGYKSISEKLRSDFMEIAIKLGYSVHEHKVTVNIAKIQTEPTINQSPAKINYNGYVYCCKVPNGLILVRRNGTATWSHNCYALSYSSQKFIDGLQGGQKPRLLFIGHHHKALYYPYRNIHVFEVPCFEAQTRFEQGKRISVNVGGWIVWIKCKPDGTVTEIVPQLVPYYDMLQNDY